MSREPEQVLIEKNIPIPPRLPRGGARRKWAGIIEGMEIGDSFQVRSGTGHMMSVRLRKQGSKATVTTSSLGCPEGYTRVWRVS